jgi:hypothetical protein
MYEIERRTILWKLPLAATAFFAALPQALRGSGPLTWDEFTARATAAAKELYNPDGYDEEAYVYRLASAAVGPPDVPAGAKTGKFGKLDPPVEFGPVYRGAPIMMVQWKLAPNAWLPPHNHPHYNVLQGRRLLVPRHRRQAARSVAGDVRGCVDEAGMKLSPRAGARGLGVREARRRSVARAATRPDPSLTLGMTTGFTPETRGPEA